MANKPAPAQEDSPVVVDSPTDSDPSAKKDGKCEQELCKCFGWEEVPEEYRAIIARAKRFSKLSPEAQLVAVLANLQ